MRMSCRWPRWWNGWRGGERPPATHEIRPRPSTTITPFAVRPTSAGRAANRSPSGSRPISNITRLIRLPIRTAKAGRAHTPTSSGIRTATMPTASRTGGWPRRWSGTAFPAASACRSRCASIIPKWSPTRRRAGGSSSATASTTRATPTGWTRHQERAIVADSIATVREATGQTIRGWLAPALTHTPRTLELIAEAGLDYTCDLYHDDRVQDVKVPRPAGSPRSPTASR